MGQPNPPGDLPLIEGLGSEWNDIVSAIPEDKRAELAPRLKERVSGYESKVKEFEPWADFQKSGITPDFADSAVRLWAQIENNPRMVYDTLAEHLGITPAEAKKVVEETQQTGSAGTKPEFDIENNPKFKTMQDQFNTMAQVMLAQRQSSEQEQLVAQQEAALDAEIKGIQAKYGKDIPEDEILMRMLHKNMTAEDAYKEYNERVTNIRARRPAPIVMGASGGIPNRQAIDPTKLDSKQTKNLVAQMLEHAKAERDAP
jgi:hypothetical protein